MSAEKLEIIPTISGRCPSVLSPVILRYWDCRATPLIPKYIEKIILEFFSECELALLNTSEP